MLPIVADFRLNALQLDFVDYRVAPEGDHLRSSQLGDDLTQMLMDDDRPGIIMCKDDPTIEEFRHQASLDAKAAGEAYDFNTLDALGKTVRDDYCPDPRFEDQSFLIYDQGTLIGSFVILRIRYNEPNGNGLWEASGGPWPRLLNWRNQKLAVLWPGLMDHFLDTDLPFRDIPGEALDLVEWKLPVDLLQAEFFRENVVDTHGSNGMEQRMLTGRDHERGGPHNMIKFIRRPGKVWTPSNGVS